VKDTILIIDFLNFLHRCRVGTLEGEYVLVYNFFRNLRATVAQFSPTKVFLCNESGTNFRYKLYPEYKANRIIKTGSQQASKDDFNSKRDLILELVSYLPIFLVKADGFEADDVVATLIENLKDENTILVSGDSDFIQLLQKGYKHFQLYNPFKKAFIETPAEHYLVPKCFVVDKSDNIPSILGPKTAAKTMADADKLKEFFASEENRANFNLNKELIELRIIDDDKLTITEYNTNYAALKEEFVRMEFNSLLDDKSWNRFVDTFKGIR
jgi:5'-3' exonuclease